MTEFKEALDRLEDAMSIKGNIESWEAVALCIGTEFNTIRRALIIADALMGEPTSNMIQASFNAPYLGKMSYESILVSEWKAMRDQMIADLDKGE